MIIIVRNLPVRWNGNINASTQLINLGDNPGGGSRCGTTDAGYSSAGRFLKTNVGDGVMWRVSSVASLIFLFIYFFFYSW